MIYNLISLLPLLLVVSTVSAQLVLNIPGQGNTNFNIGGGGGGPVNTTGGGSGGISGGNAGGGFVGFNNLRFMFDIKSPTLPTELDEDLFICRTTTYLTEKLSKEFPNLSFAGSGIDTGWIDGTKGNGILNFTADILTNGTNDAVNLPSQSDLRVKIEEMMNQDRENFLNSVIKGGNCIGSAYREATDFTFRLILTPVIRGTRAVPQCEGTTCAPTFMPGNPTSKCHIFVFSLDSKGRL